MQEGALRSFKDLSDWTLRNYLRTKREQAKRQGRAVKASGQMIRPGAPRHLATKSNRTWPAVPYLPHSVG